MTEIIGQIVGVIAAALAVISFQQKTHKSIVSFQLAANIAFIINFALIGNMTGAVLNGVAFARSVIFINKGKQWADHSAWLWFFCLLSIASGLITGYYDHTGWRSILPTAGMVCSTVAFWVKTPKNVRLLSFVSSPLWLVYNLVSSPPAVGGIITEVVNMTSIITAIIRLDLIGNRKMNNIQK